MWTYYEYKGQVTTYQVSDTGEVRNTKTGRILKGTIDRWGYRKIHISKPEDKVLFLHRMVAETYIPNDNPEEKTIVNHKDGNKLNNSIGNLEWCTNKDNCNHSFEQGMTGTNVEIFYYDKNKTLMGSFISISSASRVLGLSKDLIRKALSDGEIHKGYYFRTKSNELNLSQSTYKGKQVLKSDLNNNPIETYNSISEAAALNHIRKRTIADCCHGRTKTGKGFIWKFI